MEKELASLDRHNAWDMCKCPKNVKLVKSGYSLLNEMKIIRLNKKSINAQ